MTILMPNQIKEIRNVVFESQKKLEKEFGFCSVSDHLEHFQSVTFNLEETFNGAGTHRIIELKFRKELFEVSFDFTFDCGTHNEQNSIIDFECETLEQVKAILFTFKGLS